MTVLAVVRPDAQNIALLVHVLGAMTMVGALALASAALVGAWRSGSVALVRLGYRALLWAALPAWIVMRVGAEWILDKQGLADEAPGWADVGYMTSEPGLLFIVIATVVAGLAVRRAGRDEPTGSGRQVAAVLVSLVIVMYVVTIWAMTTKPS